MPSLGATRSKRAGGYLCGFPSQLILSQFSTSRSLRRLAGGNDPLWHQTNGVNKPEQGDEGRWAKHRLNLGRRITPQKNILARLYRDQSQISVQAAGREEKVPTHMPKRSSFFLIRSSKPGHFLRYTAMIRQIQGI